MLWLLGCAAPPAAPAPEQAWLEIPAERVTLGGNSAPNQPPAQVFELGAYGLQATEVSLAAWRGFVEAGGYADDAQWSEPGLDWRSQQSDPAERWERYQEGREESHPVVGVSYYEAEAYCRWIGGRLPTEWEWERAARGSDQRRYPWGDQHDGVEAIWDRSGKFARMARVETVPADSSDPALISPHGALHMAGNVWEWTQSDFVASGPWKVLRGGSWMNLPSYCTSTHREPARPEEGRPTLGIRCAR